MKALWRDMLQKSAKEFAGGQGHLFGLVVAVTTVTKGNGAVRAGDDGAVGDSGAMYVATEVFEHPIATLNGLLAVYDPTFLAGDVGKGDVRGRPASEPHKPSPKQASELLRGNEDALVSFGCGDPLAIIAERSTCNEHVDVGMPFERSRPRVQDRKSRDTATEMLWVTTQGCQGVECRPEEHGQQLTLVTTNNEPKLLGQSEDDMEVGHGEKQLTLLLKPLVGAHSPALRARPIVARVVLEVTSST